MGTNINQTNIEVRARMDNYIYENLDAIIHTISNDYGGLVNHCWN